MNRKIININHFISKINVKLNKIIFVCNYLFILIVNKSTSKKNTFLYFSLSSLIIVRLPSSKSLIKIESLTKTYYASVFISTQIRLYSS